MEEQSLKNELNPELSAIVSVFVEQKRNIDNNNKPLKLDSLDNFENKRIPDFSIRMDHIKGQFEFYALTEEENFINLSEFGKKDYFNHYLTYRFCKNNCSHRYYLSELKNDLQEINKYTKLLYIILFSPKYLNVLVFTLDQLLSFKIEGSSNIEFTEDKKDSLDKYYDEISKVKNPCPGCNQEWDDKYCHYCGYPN